jgi:hypothetical protein
LIDHQELAVELNTETELNGFTETGLAALELNGGGGDELDAMNGPTRVWRRVGEIRVMALRVLGVMFKVDFFYYYY